MVANIIEQKKDEIAALCRQYRVRALWVFGSAVTDAFDPERSDLDFLVDLGDYDEMVHRRFFGLLHELERLLGRQVDLLTVRSIDNPYFEEELQATRMLLYGSPGATEEILEYTSDIDFEQFAAQRMRQRATCFAFAILGEALNELLRREPDFRSQIPDAQLSIDMRHRLIHGYSSIDVGVVWATAKHDIPNISDALRDLLAAE